MSTGCSSCSYQLEAEMKYCPKCGHEKEERCQNCDGPIKSDWNFCPICRSPIIHELNKLEPNNDSLLQNTPLKEIKDSNSNNNEYQLEGQDIEIKSGFKKIKPTTSKTNIGVDQDVNKIIESEQDKSSPIFLNKKDKKIYEDTLSEPLENENKLIYRENKNSLDWSYPQKQIDQSKKANENLKQKKTDWNALNKTFSKLQDVEDNTEGVDLEGLSIEIFLWKSFLILTGSNILFVILPIHKGGIFFYNSIYHIIYGFVITSILCLIKIKVWKSNVKVLPRIGLSFIFYILNCIFLIIVNLIFYKNFNIDYGLLANTDRSYHVASYSLQLLIVHFIILGYQIKNR